MTETQSRTVDLPQHGAAPTHCTHTHSSFVADQLTFQLVKPDSCFSMATACAAEGARAHAL